MALAAMLVQLLTWQLPPVVAERPLRGLVGQEGTLGTTFGPKALVQGCLVGSVIECVD